MRLVQVVNVETDAVTGGGSSRIKALDEFVDARGGERIVVQDAAWWASGVRRLARPIGLAREISSANPDVLMLRYPGFPFFWSVRENTPLVRSLFFARRLAAVKQRLGFRVVVDILDLLRFPSPNPDMALRVSDSLLARFERSLFELSDEIWACSYSIGRHLVETYGLDNQKVRIVLNGDFRARAPTREWPEDSLGSGVRFFYAGDLAQGWRGAEIMMEAFLAGAGDAEASLVVCGTNGEWVKEVYGDSRVINLGVLAPGDVAAVGARCHVGLIPQPEQGYYHLAFPTKLGLYLTLGLPVITTRAREAAEFVERHGVGVAASADHLAQAIGAVVRDPLSLDSCREAARGMAESFYWDSIYSRAFDSFLARVRVSDDASGKCRL